MSASGILDWAILPLLATLAWVETGALVAAALPSPVVIFTVMATMALVLAALERVRPEREDYLVLDQPLSTEVAHYLFNYNLGYVLALPLLAGAQWFAAAYLPDAWPTHWPLAVQVLVAAVLGETISYWQHRLVHRVDWLWRFHALHHSGAVLNLYRGARFHFVDIGPAFLLLALPLVLLRAPETIVTFTAALAGSLGAVQHSNIRCRTPWFVDRVFCTPAVHRLHHSRDRRESDANFGTGVTFLDQLFGSYLQPRSPGPVAMGIKGDARRPGFWSQMLDPFRTRARADAAAVTPTAERGYGS